MKKISQRRAEIVRDTVAKVTGIDPENFKIFQGSHENYSDACKVLVCEGYYPTDKRWDYWTDATMWDDLTEPLRKMGLYLEPATVASAAIVPMAD